MSLEETYKLLKSSLEKEDEKVIALTGKWGTGKTYAWKKIQEESGSVKIKNALYTSMFGVYSIDQVKNKLIYNAAKKYNSKSGFLDNINQPVKSMVKIFEGFHKGFSVINDIGLIIFPSYVKNNLIVLDDIERKHKNLGVDEILGLVDEISKQFDCRFLLIFNDNKLEYNEDDKLLWNTLREKVVDQEFKLTTSPSESFNIAISNFNLRFKDQIKESIEICEITNIRVINKILKIIQDHMNDKDIKDSVIKRIIPSTVLLSGIYFRGVNSRIDIDYVLNFNSSFFLLDSDNKEDIDEEENHRRNLLRKLGIYASDEYEYLFVEFLKSGRFESEKLDRIIDLYSKNSNEARVRSECIDFFENYIWNHKITDLDLLKLADKISNSAEYLSPNMLTSFCDTVCKIDGGTGVEEKAVNLWIEGFRKKDFKDFRFDEFYHSNLHRDIKEEFLSLDKELQSNVSIYDACVYVKENDSWGARQEFAFKSATVDDIRDIITTLNVKEFKFFMQTMAEFSAKKTQYIEHFGPAMDNFIAACQQIIDSNESDRLKKIIGQVLQSYKIPAI